MTIDEITAENEAALRSALAGMKPKRTRPPQHVRHALRIVNAFNREGIGMTEVIINGESYPDRAPFVVEAFRIVNEYYRKGRRGADC